MITGRNSLQIIQGLSTNRTYLSCNDAGNVVDLWSSIGVRQCWEFVEVPTKPDVYYIKVSAGVTPADKIYLGYEGHQVGLYNSAGEAQEWEIKLIADMTNLYTIKRASPSADNYIYLSCTGDGLLVDLWTNVTSRQQWQIETVNMNNVFAMCLTGTKGAIYTSYSNDGQNWSYPYITRRFEGWETEDTPSIISFQDTLYMCLSGKDGRIYIATYGYNANLQQWCWNNNTLPNCLFNGWETYKNRTPNFLIIDSQLSMVLMDTDGVVHLTQFNSSEQVWQQPYRIFGAWKCLFTPTLALHSDNAYMCLNDTDGCIYVTSYDTKAHQWTNPNYKGSNLFNGWETYCNRTPSIISYQGTLRMALMDHKGGVFTSKWVNNIWTSPEKLFGDWKCYYSPTFSIFDGNLYMAICDTSGRTYVTTYDTPTSSWNAPIYQKTELFEGGETYACIPAKMCETSLNRLIPMIGLKNWMLPLDSTKLISEVTIPGTHDSGAHQGGAGAECQTMSIEQQLNRGIRYFDIRCRHIQDRFAIYHGAYRQDLLFGNDVLKICLDFLKNNPTEFLVFAIQSASSEKDNSRSFEETFRWYIGEKYQCDANWYLKNEIPSIQDVRGKIILIRRFSADTILGIDANGSKWNSDVDSCEFKFSDTQTLSIQDHNYVTTIFNLRDKWNLIKSQLDKAKNAIDKNTLYLNFSSGSGGAFPKDIAKASSPGFTGENYRLDEELSSNPKGHYGILAMDYPETPTDLIGRIISSNPEIF